MQPLTPHLQQIVEQHLNLVRPIALSVMLRVPASFEFDDLLSEGMLGLMDAASRFDPARGVPFRAFAAMRIRFAILESVRNKRWRENTHPPIDDAVLEIAGSGAESVEAPVEQNQRARLVAEARAGLGEKHAQVIEIYFDRDEKLTGIGRALGVKQSRSSQVLQESKRALGKQLAWRGLKPAA